VSGRTKEQIFVFLKNVKKTKRQRKNCDINTRGGKSVIKCDKMEQAYSSPAGLQILQVELPAASPVDHPKAGHDGQIERESSSSATTVITKVA